MNVKRITDVDLKGKRVLMRVDFNVPIKDRKITNTKRIEASIPTIKYALDHGAALIVMSHLGQPKEGEFSEDASLALLVDTFAKILGHPVRFEKNWLDGVKVAPGEVVLCENVRFNKGEKKDDEALAKKMAALCDVFVMDAFATAHRAQASTHGVAKFAPIACAGLLLTAELDALDKALANPAHPLIAIVGGAKVSTKFLVLKNLLNKVDRLLVGGGIANTFMAAAGLPVGKSLYEPDYVDQAKELLALAKSKGAEIPLPIDVIVAKELTENAKPILKKATDVSADDMILDIGPETAKKLTAIINDAKTIVWNGPVGVFEFDQFAEGTKALALAVAKSNAFSIAGGGETIAAIDKYGIEKDISYISTAGGAFLEYLQGETLPAVAMLEERAK